MCITPFKLPFLKSPAFLPKYGLLRLSWWHSWRSVRGITPPLVKIHLAVNRSFLCQLPVNSLLMGVWKCQFSYQPNRIQCQMKLRYAHLPIVLSQLMNEMSSKETYLQEKVPNFSSIGHQRVYACLPSFAITFTQTFLTGLLWHT